MASCDAGVEFFHVIFGVREKIAEVVITLGGGNDLLDGEFFLAVIKFYAAANLNHIVTFESRREEGEVVPHFRGDGAGAVGEPQFEPGLSAADGGAYLFFANEKE